MNKKFSLNMSKIPLNEQFKISYNFLTFILIVEGVLLLIEVFSNGYSNKAFFYLLFLIMTKISQINTIHYFNRLELM